MKQRLSLILAVTALCISIGTLAYNSYASHKINLANNISLEELDSEWRLVPSDNKVTLVITNIT